MTLLSHGRTSDSSTADVALVSDDLFAVLSETRTLGYVHRVGPVYVALCGADLNHAVEVGQSLSWDQAVDMVTSL